MWILLTLKYAEVDLSRLEGGGVVIVLHIIILNFIILYQRSTSTAQRRSYWLTVVWILLTLNYTGVDSSRLLGGGVVIVVHLIIPKIHLLHCAKGQFLRASNKTSRFTIWNKDNMKDTIWRKIFYKFVPERNSKDLHSRSREVGIAMSKKETLVEKHDSKYERHI